jgi:hypothetical protein
MSPEIFLENDYDGVQYLYIKRKAPGYFLGVFTIPPIEDLSNKNYPGS